MCELLPQAPVAVFGPFNDISAMHVQSMCENFEIPHIEARLLIDFKHRTDLSINLNPHYFVLSKVFISLLDSWKWTTFVVIYEDSDSIVHFSDFFERSNEKSWTVSMFQLKPDVPYRDILWQVKQTGILNIFLDIRTENLFEVLRQVHFSFVDFLSFDSSPFQKNSKAQQVGIMSDKHNYLVTSLDFHTIELTDYRYSKTNITSLRMVHENHPILNNIMSQWDALSIRLMKRSIPMPKYLKVGDQIEILQIYQFEISILITLEPFGDDF